MVHSYKTFKIPQVDSIITSIKKKKENIFAGHKIRFALPIIVSTINLNIDQTRNEEINIAHHNMNGV